LQGRPEFVGTIEAEADEILAFVGWRANPRWVVEGHARRMEKGPGSEVSRRKR
jgi:hypothetical protein